MKRVSTGSRILFLFLAVGAFLCLAFPIYVIRPFRAQGSDELAGALLVRQFGPAFATLLALVSVGIAVYLWPRVVTRKGKAAMSLAAFLTCAFAALSWVNIYELMFHPMGAPDLVAARDAKLDSDDMVMAVEVGGQSRAYPIRTMAYHHIANDWLGGRPIVATY